MRTPTFEKKDSDPFFLFLLFLFRLFMSEILSCRSLSNGFGLRLFSISCLYFSILLLSFVYALACIFFVLLASLCSFFPFWARAVVFIMASTPWWSCGALPNLVLAPRLVSRRCSALPGSAPMRVCRKTKVFLREFRIPVPTSTASPRSRHRGTLRLPAVVNLAPR